MRDLSPFLVRPGATIRDAMVCVNRNALGVALLIGGAGRLLATVTDGDLRHAVLKNLSLDLPIESIVAEQRQLPYPSPITAPDGASIPELLRLMNTFSIRHVPLVDAQGCVVDLAILDEIASQDGATDREELPARALVVAGGLGKRLRPLTADLPKPMLPVGGRPLLEHTIDRLRRSGVREIWISTHYRSEAITGHFGDGSEFGVSISYLNEETPLGNAGALRRLPPSEDATLVVNGDVLTSLDFRLFYDFHATNEAQLCVGVRLWEVEVPYGVLDLKGAEVSRLNEKPMLYCFINAGVYLLSPDAFRALPANEAFHMTDVIQELMNQRRRVVSYPIYDSWIDIGSPADYDRAVALSARPAGDR